MVCITLTPEQYKLFSLDMDLEFSYENTYFFDITYLVQGILGHDQLNMYCDADIEVTLKGSYVEITGLSITGNGNHSDEDIILIFEMVEHLLEEYGGK
jgi:hypothetical protein